MKSNAIILLAFFSIFTQEGFSQVNGEQHQVSHERSAYFPQQRNKVIEMPPKENVWVFIMAGQSNMSGRGQVMPQDTVPHPRVLSLSKELEWTIAKEPLHEYKPNLMGLDCGLTFGKELVSTLDDSIYVALVPTAIGGTSVGQWLGDSLFRGVKLLSNFTEKLQHAKKSGQIKGILWSQGESDGNQGNIRGYKKHLRRLFQEFRALTENESLPIFMTEIGEENGSGVWQKNRHKINKIIRKVAQSDKNIHLIASHSFEMKDDNVHLSDRSQRLLGKLFATKYMEILRK